MIELPGCIFGSSTSLRPVLGPEFIRRMSFAILLRRTAKDFNTPLTNTKSAVS